MFILQELLLTLQKKRAVASESYIEFFIIIEKAVNCQPHYIYYPIQWFRSQVARYFTQTAYICSGILVVLYRLLPFFQVDLFPPNYCFVAVFLGFFVFIIPAAVILSLTISSNLIRLLASYCSLPLQISCLITPL